MLTRSCHLFIVIILSFSLGAQEDSMSDMERSLSLLTDPNETLLVLDQLVDASSISDLKGMRNYAFKALAIGNSIKKDTIRGKANLVAGKAYMHLASYDTASVYLDAALELLDPVTQKSAMATAHHWRAYVNANIREFGDAAVHYYQAVEIWEELGLHNELARTYAELSDMHSMQQDYNKAINYAEQAIELLEEMNDPERLAEALNNLSFTHVLSGNPEAALKYASESLLIWEEIAPGGRQVARVSNSRGNAHKFLGNYEAAIADYERCMNLSEDAGFIRGLIVGTGNIGHVLLMQNKYKEALPYTLRAIELMKESGDTRNLWENYMHATDIYEGLGDYENAFRYRELQHEEKERELDQKIISLQGGLADKYEAGQRAATIVLQEMQIQKQRNFQWLLGGFVVLFLLTSGLIYASLRSRQKANRKLALANEQLEKKNQENELLVREIHHRVKNNLQVVSSLLNLQSAGISDETALAAVQESRNRVRAMSLIHQKLYQGEQLASIEMKDYFETMGQAMLQSFGAQKERVALNVNMSPILMDVDTAIPIGLIVNELVTNSLKYAFPDQKEGLIELSLIPEDENTLVLSLADNGVGNTGAHNSAWSQSSTGFGGRLVHLLVQQLDGAIDQEETNGYATVIRFANTRKAV